MAKIPIYGKEEYFLQEHCNIACDSTPINKLQTKHSHTFYEIFFVITGSAYYLHNDAVKIINKGDIFFIYPTDTHCYTFYKSEEFYIYNIAFSKEILTEILEFLECDTIISTQNTMQEYDIAFYINTLQHIEKYLKQQNFKKAKAYTKSVCSLLIETFFTVPQKKDPTLPIWLATTLKEMKKKENFALGYKKMCELANCTPNHLTRTVKRYLNKTPTTIINENRIQYAVYLLKMTDKPIITISEECGFDNLSHFYHVFKKQLGISPTKLRKTQV